MFLVEEYYFPPAVAACVPLENPVGGTVSVTGCSATYMCNRSNSEVLTRQCLSTNQWNGTEPDCPGDGTSTLTGTNQGLIINYTITHNSTVICSVNHNC